MGSRTSELVGVLCSLARSAEGVALLASPLDKLPPSAYDCRSVVFFYSTRQGTLEPNYEVSVGVCRENCASVLKDVESVQKRSRVFYVPPPEGDVVFVAYAGGRPVGATYLNPGSFNLDYGIHVAREFWRRRIGTRLLKEALDVARSEGAELLSVVRVLRSKTGASSDRRAIAFYSASHPVLGLDVYRLTR